MVQGFYPFAVSYPHETALLKSTEDGMFCERNFLNRKDFECSRGWKKLKRSKSSVRTVMWDPPQLEPETFIPLHTLKFLLQSDGLS